MTQTCTKCGYDNASSAWVCNLCGEVLRYSAGHGRKVRRTRIGYTEVLTMRKKNLAAGWGLALFLVLLYGAYIGLFFFLFAQWQDLSWPTQAWTGTNEVLTRLYLLLLFITWSALLLGLVRADQLVARLSGARTASHEEEQQIANLLSEQALAFRIKEPELRIIPDAYPNAMAAGIRPGKSMIMVTTGLLDLLSRQQTALVLGHECAHIRNGDAFHGTILAILAGSIVVVRDFGLQLMLSSFVFSRRSLGTRAEPAVGSFALRVIAGGVLALTGTVFGVVAWISVFAVSRRREIVADMDSALINKDPASLASALTEISTISVPMTAFHAPFQHLYFSNPDADHSSTGHALFRTHPPVEARIRLLQDMA